MQVIKTCAICGKSYEGDNRSVYCSEECKKKAKYFANRNARKKRQEGRICKWCGASFNSTYELRKYCCERCAQAAKNESIKKSKSYQNRNKHVIVKISVPKSPIMEAFKKEHKVLTSEEGDNYLSHQNRQIKKTMELYGRVIV